MAESTILGYKSLYTVYKRGVKLSGKKSYTDCNLTIVFPSQKKLEKHIFIYYAISGYKNN